MPPYVPSATGVGTERVGAGLAVGGGAVVGEAVGTGAAVRVGVGGGGGRCGREKRSGVPVGAAAEGDEAADQNGEEGSRAHRSVRLPAAGPLAPADQPHEPAHRADSLPR